MVLEDALFAGGEGLGFFEDFRRGGEMSDVVEEGGVVKGFFFFGGEMDEAGEFHCEYGDVCAVASEPLVPAAERVEDGTDGLHVAFLGGEDEPADVLADVFDGCAAGVGYLERGLCDVFVPDADVVAASALGGEECVVGATEEFVFGVDVGGEGGYADADGDVEFFLSGFYLGLFDGFPDISGAFDGAVEVGVGEYDGEFFAAVPGGDIDGACRLDDELAECAEDFVADEVSIGVVDAFEVVHVDHDAAERDAVAVGAHEFVFESVVEESVIEEAGEVVGDGETFEFVEELPALGHVSQDADEAGGFSEAIAEEGEGHVDLPLRAGFADGGEFSLPGGA